MMSAMAEQSSAQEPTMEEILASIRRIISEDDAPASTAAQSASAPAAAPLKADSDDVLELTERAEPSPFEAEPEPAAEPASAEPAKGGSKKKASPFARFEKGGDDDEPKYDDSRFDASMFDKTDIELIAPEAQPAPSAPEPAAPPPAAAQPQPQPQPVSQAMPESKDEGLISQPTAATVASAFSALSRNVPMPPPGRSLEDLVKEMMKPMLRDWLDQNLAGIVEAKVQAEVERLSRQI